MQQQRTGVDPDSIILHLVIFGVLFVIGFWPYLVWHGHNASGHMTWTAASWTGCLIWWMAAPVAIWVISVLAKANSPRIRKLEQEEEKNP